MSNAVDRLWNAGAQAKEKMSTTFDVAARFDFYTQTFRRFFTIENTGKSAILTGTATQFCTLSTIVTKETN